MKYKGLLKWKKAVGLLALTTIMSIGMAMPALVSAEEGTQTTTTTGPSYSGGVYAGSEANPIESIALKKILKMPQNTDVPNATFKFAIDKVSYAGARDETTLSAMPSLTAADISIASATASEDTSTHIKTATQESTISFKDINWSGKAGLYVYKVTEIHNTYTISDENKESMTYSPAEYTLTVHVANKADGGGVYVKEVTVKTGDISVLDDKDNQSTNTKVDPTPGGSEMTFTNTYLKTPSGGENPSSSNHLAISKTVDRTTAGDTTKYFTFDVQITRPATVTAERIYKGYIMEGGKIINITSDNLVDGVTSKKDGYGDYIEFGTGARVYVRLKDGQQLVFADTSVGTFVTVNETGNGSWTPSVTVTLNEKATTTSGAESDTLSTGQLVLDEKSNTIAYTNKYKDVTPTGILLNNLPVIAPVAVALVLLAAVAVLNSKRRSSRS